MIDKIITTILIIFTGIILGIFFLLIKVSLY